MVRKAWRGLKPNPQLNFELTTQLPCLDFANLNLTITLSISMKLI